MPIHDYIILAAGALMAATVSGVAGVGGGMVYLPILAEIVGMRLAVPYLSLLLLAGNFSRAYFARKGIDWQVLRAFLLTAIPGAAIGALGYSFLPAIWIAKLLGAYLLIYVGLNFLRVQWPKTANLRSMSWIGIPAGVSSGVVGGSGLIIAPYFLRYGLVKEAFIGTEALAAAGTHVTKAIVWGGTSVLTMKDVILLLPLTVLMVAGSYFGKILVSRMRARLFRGILLMVLAAVGIRFLFFFG
ncbi:MAG: sulfite exporter TauE/SafE family protein [Calditrichaeota bacterium]|nr:sulfite exporter TauE/SafE family protein [Calditrichota bacterium]MCB9368843.1 sulfite exporter TauE/SafE family protein [Calditrichota bacterium]